MFLKSMLLASVRPFYDGEKEGNGGTEEVIEEVKKTPAEIKAEARSKIEVVTSKKTEQEEPEKKEEEETEVEEVEEKKEEVEAKKDDETPTVEQLQKTVERLQKRLDKTTGTNKDLKRDLEAAKAAVTAKKEEGALALTEDDVEKEAEKRANVKMAERQFANACDKLFKEAVKVDKGFKAKIDNLASEVSAIPGAMIGILEDLDNGGEVLSNLANDEDEYERIISLNPVKMGIELDRLSNKLVEAKKKKTVKEISKVPVPIETVNGTRQANGEITQADVKDMDVYVAKRRRQMEEKRRGMR